MIEVQRYDLRVRYDGWTAGSLKPNDKGKWVRFEDIDLPCPSDCADRFGDGCGLPGGIHCFRRAKDHYNKRRKYGEEE